LAEDEGDALVEGAEVEGDVEPATVHSAAGIENGSRPFTCFTPVGDGEGLPEGAIVGDPIVVGGPIVVGCPPPPLNRLKARITTRTAATPPRMITRRRSR